MATSIKDQINELEESLLEADTRQSIQALNRLLADDFLEFGASGNIYTKQEILDYLLTEKDYSKTSLFDFELKTLSKDAVQVVYKTQRKENTTIVLRSSIWRRHASFGWQMCFHQGTIAAKNT
jgi:hypothetical protein